MRLVGLDRFSYRVLQSHKHPTLELLLGCIVTLKKPNTWEIRNFREYKLKFDLLIIVSLVEIGHLLFICETS